jgi:hypothetical protein
VRLQAPFSALVAAFVLAAPAFAGMPPSHEISVTIDPQTRLLEGRDTISFDSPRKAVLLLSPRFRIASLAADGRPMQVHAQTAAGLTRITLPAVRRVELSWGGTLAALDRNVDHRYTLSADAPVSGPEGTFLAAGSG